MIAARRRAFCRFAAVLIGLAIFIALLRHYQLQLRHQYHQKMAMLRSYWNVLAFGHDPQRSHRIRQAVDKCKNFLLKEAINKPFKRRFDYETPIRIYGADAKEPINVTCAVGCIHQRGTVYRINRLQRPDATFEKVDKASRESLGVLNIYRTMESTASLPASAFDAAKTSYDIVMTPSLKTHVPVPYFSWVMHNFMKPLQQRDPAVPHIASALISNCIAASFRLQAIDEFEKVFGTNATIYFRGKCAPNPLVLKMSGNRTVSKFSGKRVDGDKLAIIRQYKFHFAFENSEEEDYVTEKFFEALIEGTVPVVIGAPNIEDFAPARNSVFSLKTLEDVSRIASKMLALDRDDKAYNRMLAWKSTGLSDKFKALVDIAVVHSSCRLCIYIADRVRLKEECEMFDASSLDVNCSDIAATHGNDDWGVIKMLRLEENTTTTTPVTSTTTSRPPDSPATTAKMKSVRQCKCRVETEYESDGHFDLHLLRVRERGLFEFVSIFLKSKSVTLKSFYREILKTYQAMRPAYKPLWTAERDEFGRQVVREEEQVFLNRTNMTIPQLRIYRVYPVGVSQRAALYEGASIDTDRKLLSFVHHRPCGRLEVIFI